MPNTPTYYTIKEYAAIWKVSQNTIRAWIATDKLLVERIARTIRILGRRLPPEESANGSK